MEEDKQKSKLENSKKIIRNIVLTIVGLFICFGIIYEVTNNNSAMNSAILLSDLIRDFNIYYPNESQFGSFVTVIGIVEKIQPVISTEPISVMDGNIILITDGDYRGTIFNVSDNDMRGISIGDRIVVYGELRQQPTNGINGFVRLPIYEPSSIKILYHKID